MMVSISRPTSVVVSHQASPSDTKPQESPSSDVVEVAAGTRQAVQLGHHDHIAGQERLQQFLELWPAVRRLGRRLLAQDPLAAGGAAISSQSEFFRNADFLEIRRPPEMCQQRR
jgi:hypothetical protein